MAKWKRGQSGNALGKPRGALNRTTKDVRELANGLVTDGRYLERLKLRLLDGTVSPAVETLLWFYSFGKPQERLEIESAPPPPLIIEIRDCTPPAE
jgi:hypothetical protein